MARTIAINRSQGRPRMSSVPFQRGPVKLILAVGAGHVIAPAVLLYGDGALWAGLDGDQL